MEWPAFYSMTMNQTWTQKVKLILVTFIQGTAWLSEERHGAPCCDLQRKEKKNTFIPILDILCPASV